MLKKPYSLLFLPYFCYLYIKLRWNKEAETIYLTETNLKDNFRLMNESSQGFSLKELTDLNECKSLAVRRIADEGYSENYEMELLKRLDRSDKIFTLSHGLELCSFVFVSERIADLSQLSTILELPPNCFAVYDVYTFKEFRGRGLYEILLSKVLKEMDSRGFTHFWLWVMAHNQISVKVHEKLGINHVVSKFSQYYRFGVRHYSATRTDFYLRDLIK